MLAKARGRSLYVPSSCRTPPHRRPPFSRQTVGGGGQQRARKDRKERNTAANRNLLHGGEPSGRDSNGLTSPLLFHRAAAVSRNQLPIYKRQKGNCQGAQISNPRPVFEPIARLSETYFLLLTRTVRTVQHTVAIKRVRRSDLGITLRLSHCLCVALRTAHDDFPAMLLSSRQSRRFAFFESQTLPRLGLVDHSLGDSHQKRAYPR